MKANTYPRAKIEMQSGALQRMRKTRRRATLSCDTGVLWVTQTGDRKDHILLAGDEMVMAGRGTVLVQAMRDAAFLVA